MNCKNSYDQEFIIKNLNRNWLDNDYKKHLGNLLIETEKNKIPDIMIYVENYKKIPELENRLNETRNLLSNINKQLKKLKLKIHEKTSELNLLESDFKNKIKKNNELKNVELKNNKYSDYHKLKIDKKTELKNNKYSDYHKLKIDKKTELKKLSDEYYNTETLLYDIRHIYYEINRTINSYTNFKLTQSDQKNIKKKFIRRCPLTNCKGFLSENWQCGLCLNLICKKCMEIKEEDSKKKIIHVCDEKN